MIALLLLFGPAAFTTYWTAALLRMIWITDKTVVDNVERWLFTMWSIFVTMITYGMFGAALGNISP
jgi:hypothetical protein